MKEYEIEIIQIAEVKKIVLAENEILAIDIADRQSDGDFEDEGNATYRTFYRIHNVKELK